MQDVSAKLAGLQDSCSSKLLKFQQPRPLVSGDGKVWLRGFYQVEEKTVRRIVCLVPSRQRGRPNGRAVKVIEHGANLIGLQLASELGVSTRCANFIDLLLAGQQMETAVAPMIGNFCRRAMG